MQSQFDPAYMNFTNKHKKTGEYIYSPVLVVGKIYMCSTLFLFTENLHFDSIIY